MTLLGAAKAWVDKDIDSSAEPIIAEQIVAHLMLLFLL